MQTSLSQLSLWLRFVVVALCWGTCYLWIKLGLRELEPQQLVFWRLLISGILLLLFVQGRGEFALLRRANWKNFFLMAFLSPFAPFLLVAWAQKFIDSGVASILNATTLLFGVLLSAVFLKDEPLTRRKIVAVSIGFLGIVFLFKNNLRASFWDGQFLGKAAVLLSSLCYGACSVFARAKFKELSGSIQNTGITLAAFVFIFIVNVFGGGGVVVPQSLLTWAAVFWLAVFGNVIAYSLYFSLLQHWGVARAASVNYVYPVIGLLLGNIFLSEVITSSLLFGASLIVVSVILLKKSRGREQ